MIVVMTPAATPQQTEDVLRQLQEWKIAYHLSRGEERTVIGLLGNTAHISREDLLDMPGVEDAIRITKPFKLASREFHPQDTIVEAASVRIGAPGTFSVIAGPCSVESREHMIEVADFVKEQGANLLRGGAFKPRTSPYSFQGLGADGLEYLAKQANAPAFQW